MKKTFTLVQSSYLFVNKIQLKRNIPLTLDVTELSAADIKQINLYIKSGVVRSDDGKLIETKDDGTALVPGSGTNTGTGTGGGTNSGPSLDDINAIVDNKVAEALEQVDDIARIVVEESGVILLEDDAQHTPEAAEAVAKRGKKSK